MHLLSKPGLLAVLIFLLVPSQTFGNKNRAGGIPACEANLNSCNTDLGNCEGSLGTCEGALASCDAELSDCDADLSAANDDLASCNGNLASCSSDLDSCNADLDSCNSDLDTALGMDVCDFLPEGTGIDNYRENLGLGLFLTSMTMNGGARENWLDGPVDISMDWNSPPQTYCPGCISFNEVYLAPTNGPVQLLGCFGPGIRNGLSSGGSYSNGAGASGSVQFTVDLTGAETGTYRLLVRKSWVYYCGQYTPGVAVLESRPLHIFCNDY